MVRKYSSVMQLFWMWFSLLLLTFLAACEPVGGDKSTSSSTSSSSSGGVTPTSAPSLTLKLSTTTISSAQTATATVTLLDGNNNPLSNEIITLSTDSVFGTLSQTSVLTDTNGKAAVTLVAGATSGASSLTATYTPKTGTGTSASTNFAVVAAGTPTMDLTLASNTISATGTTATAVLKDANGGVISNAVVRFTVDDPTIGAVALGSVLTNVNGVATVQLNAVGKAGAANLTASYTAADSKQVAKSVGFSSTGVSSTTPRITLSLGSNALVANGVTTVTATVVDASGNPINSALVTFNTTLGSVSQTTALTDATGKAAVTLSAGTVSNAGTVSSSFTGSGVTISQSSNFQVTAQSLAAPKISLSMVTNILSGNQSTAVTVTLKDGSDAPIKDATIRFSNASAIATLSQSSDLTDVNGQVTITLTAGAQFGADTLIASYTPASGSAVSASSGYAVKVANVPSIQLTLGATSIVAGQNVSVVAVLKDASGSPMPQQVVRFSTNSTFGTLSKDSELTDSSGRASITLAVGSKSGADTVTASSTVAGTTVSNAANYQASVSSTPTDAITLSAITLGAASISAYDSTTVDVNVLNNGVIYTTPLKISFSSVCATNGKATITSSSDTVNGQASAIYKDNGCGTTDVITASLTGVASQTKSIIVASPSLGSIQFVSASPTSITLKGTGGAGLAETSKVTFKVVDQSGNAIKVPVSFSLSTNVGGVTLSNATGTSDPVTGLVSTNVQSGTVGTPVRVTAQATFAGSSKSTQSDQLTISTGLPDQKGFSLSATAFNIEGLNYDGTTTTVTIRAADHFANPVPAGTVINFIAEGAKIGSSCQTDSSGACSVTFESQSFRPSDGRVSVLAYAVGEETFVDADGDGLADIGELVDADNKNSDMPEAWVDANESKTYSNSASTVTYFNPAAASSSLYNSLRPSSENLTANIPSETFIDFDSSGAYNSADGKYNGILCNESTGDASKVSLPNTCSLTKSIHVRQTDVIVLSGSTAFMRTTAPSVIDLNVDANGNSVSAALRGCGPARTYIFYVFDRNGNPMPAGTTVVFTADNGTISGTSSYIVGNSNALPFNHPSGNDGNYSYGVSIKGNGSIDADTGLCKDSSPSGSLTMTVTTPKQRVTSYSLTVNN